MPQHKILVLGEHSHGKGPRGDRAMNIACGVVIAVVIVAMIVATIVYFCVQKNSSNGNGFGAAAPGTNTKKVTSAPKVQATKHGDALLPGAGKDMKSFGPVPANVPVSQDQAILFPKLTAEDERELAKSHNAAFVKNYPSGYKNAVLTDPKYHMVDKPTRLYGTADYFPYRGKEDDIIVQLQMKQAQKYEQPFNMSEDQFRWKHQGMRHERL